MRATILRNERAEQFYDLTGIRGKSIIVYQNGRYYYAIVVDKSFCVRIEKETASYFM